MKYFGIICTRNMVTNHRICFLFYWEVQLISLIIISQTLWWICHTNNVSPCTYYKLVYVCNSREYPLKYFHFGVEYLKGYYLDSTSGYSCFWSNRDEVCALFQHWGIVTRQRALTRAQKKRIRTNFPGRTSRVPKCWIRNVKLILVEFLSGKWECQCENAMDFSLLYNTALLYCNYDATCN